MQATLTFLAQLAENNTRDWFQAHKSAYQQSHEEMIRFADQLLIHMNKHDVIETPTGKKSLFRIYRDVRFSKDKSPYKTHWAGSFKRAGAERRGGYYYHLGPKASYVMGGFFGPNPQDLLHIRTHLASDSEPVRAILQSDAFVQFFGSLQGQQLKTAPKGFDKDHPDIDLLRYKQFVVRHEFSTEEMVAPNFTETMADTFRQMRPFFDAMTEILTTDLNGRSLI